jgi:hypothetical protein
MCGFEGTRRYNERQELQILSSPCTDQDTASKIIATAFYYFVLSRFYKDQDYAAYKKVIYMFCCI